LAPSVDNDASFTEERWRRRAASARNEPATGIRLPKPWVEPWANHMVPARSARESQNQHKAPFDSGRPAMLQRTLQLPHSNAPVTGDPVLRIREEAGVEPAARTSPGTLTPMTRLLRRLPLLGAGLYDPRLNWPGLVEDDYYRFRNQPSGR
jgi:hypothetical protein